MLKARSKYAKWRDGWLRTYGPFEEDLAAPPGAPPKKVAPVVPTPTVATPEGIPSGSIVVCIHNAPNDVVACLRSIAKHTNIRRHHLILVDDGSQAETQAIVLQFATAYGATHIRNDESRGYTRAANQGIRASAGDFIVLLNSDTLVTPGWLNKLASCAFSAHDIPLCQHD